METLNTESNLQIDDDKIFCEVCTFLNTSTANTCEICCNSLRSEKNVIPQPSILESSLESSESDITSPDLNDLINGIQIDLSNTNDITEFFKLSGIYYIYKKSSLKEDKIEHLEKSLPHVLMIKINNCKIINSDEKQLLLSAFMYYKGYIQSKDELIKKKLEITRNITKIQDLEFEISCSKDKQDNFTSNKKHKSSSVDTTVETVDEKRDKIASMYEKKFGK